MVKATSSACLAPGAGSHGDNSSRAVPGQRGQQAELSHPAHGSASVTSPGVAAWGEGRHCPCHQDKQLSSVLFRAHPSPELLKAGAGNELGELCHPGNIQGVPS